jgi:DNA-binding NtrC family response regulator
LNVSEQSRTRDTRVKEVAKKRVLVIDDDLPIRGMLAAALRRHGYQILLAGTVRASL